MQFSLSPIVLVAMLAGILALAALVVAFLMRPARQSWVGVTVAASPALLMVALFYSLALHMHKSLGGWPTSIGFDGFPAPLVTHASVTTGYFAIYGLASIYAWPVIFVLCLLVRRWRVCVYYLGVYALACRFTDMGGNPRTTSRSAWKVPSSRRSVLTRLNPMKANDSPNSFSNVPEFDA